MGEEHPGRGSHSNIIQKKVNNNKSGRKTTRDLKYLFLNNHKAKDKNQILYNNLHHPEDKRILSDLGCRRKQTHYQLPKGDSQKRV